MHIFSYIISVSVGYRLCLSNTNYFLLTKTYIKEALVTYSCIDLLHCAEVPDIEFKL